MSTDERNVIALGFFDGVHLGHARLLRRTCEAADGLDARARALTFDRHPESLITGHELPLLTTVGERTLLMRSLYSVDALVMHFNAATMKLSWRAFLGELLVGRFSAIHVVAGHDFHFGYKGLGNARNLKAECARLGVGCDIIERVEIDGITVSSTYIRKLVAQGDMERAALFLGHPFALSGPVVHGHKLGSTLGVPTTNIPLPREVQPPAFGVYVTRTVLPDGSVWPSLTNIGVKPTIGVQSEPEAETTLFDFRGDLYDKVLRVEFLKFLRPERRFESLGDLAARINQDVAEGRAYHGLDAEPD